MAFPSRVPPPSSSNPISDILEQIQQTIEQSKSPLKGFMSTLDSFRSGIGAVDAVMRPFGVRVRDVGNAFVNVGRAVLGAGQGLAEFTQRITHAGTAILRFPINALDSTISAMKIGIERFVAFADPATVNLFRLAVDDLYASIGRALAPVLQAATKVVRSIANAIIGLNDDGKKLIAAIAGGTVALITFGVSMGGVIAVAGVASVGVLAFAAAMAVVEAIATGGLGPILSAIGYSLGAIGVAGTGLGSVLAAIAAGATGLFAAFGDLDPLLKEASALLGGFMQVLGKEIQGLVPIARPLLDTLGLVAGFFARMTIFTVRFIASIGPLLEVIGNVSNMILSQLMPIMDALAGTAIVALSGAIAAVAGIVALAVAPFVALGLAIKGILDLIGIRLPRVGIPKSEPGRSEGASVRAVSTGDVSDVLRKARESAFSVGGGSKGPEIRTADNTEQMVSGITIMNAVLLRIADDVFGMPGRVWDFVKMLPPELAKVLHDLIPDSKDVLNALPSAPAPVQAARDFAGRATDLAEKQINRAYNALPDIF